MRTSNIGVFLRHQIAVVSGGEVDPVPDYLFRYKLDGTDANLTRVGTDDFRAGPECNDITGSYYNGSSEYDIADPDSGLVAVGTGAFSWSMWINTTIMAAADSIGNGLGGSGDGTFRCRVTGGGALRIRLGGSNRDTLGTYNDGNWHHFSVTSTASMGTILLYVDGALENTLTATTYNLIDVGGLEVASSTGNNSRWDGGLDGIRFYDRVLSPSEVTAIFNYNCLGFPLTFPITLI